MKVLLWATYSPWTMNFVEEFLLKNNHEVWILNRSNKKEYQKYVDFYKEKGVHLIELPEIVSNVYDGKEKGNIFKNWLCHFLLLKSVMKFGPFDLLNMHYIEYIYLIDMIILKYLMKTKLVLSYWGSDLFRVEKKELEVKGWYVRYADFITFDSLDLEIEFRKIYKWAKHIPSKVVFFGLPVLDIINKNCIEKTNNNLRRKWGISEDKVVIAIGYNGIPQQQHKKVLSVISRLEDEYKEKIILILQMSYGGSRGYRSSVINAVKKIGVEYINIQYFLSNDEVAELRIMTDIFINAQTTDAFSGSVCEYLFADTVLINAEWLHYKEFEKYDFQYLEFGNFDEIYLLVKQAMEQEIDTSKNKELVWRLRSWEYCAPKWQKVYKRVCK